MMSFIHYQANPNDAFPEIENYAPTMAAPFSSIDDGEVWRWDIYFCFFQKQPKSCLEAFGNSSLAESQFPVKIFYRYAMSVLNNSVPSPNPILSIGLEQFIYGEEKGEIVLGMFRKNLHSNFGEYPYDESTTPDQVRSKFFEVIKEHLKPSGEPKLVGTIKDIFPNTSSLVK